jgi:hypothetical protein
VSENVLYELGRVGGPAVVAQWAIGNAKGSKGGLGHYTYKCLIRNIILVLFVKVSHERRQRLKDGTGPCATGTSPLWRVVAQHVFFPSISCEVEVIRGGAILDDAGVRAKVILHVFPVQMS